MTEESIVDQYRRGLRGYIPDPAKDAAFESHLRQTHGYFLAGDAADDYGLNDIGKDVVSLPYLAAMDIYPGCLPGGRQKRGSCVAWATRNALMVSFCSYLKYGENHERYAAPKLSDTAISHGAFSTEAIYWFRGHGSDGWQGSEAALVATTKSGLVARQKYDDLGLDLTVYNVNTEGRWGASPPPQSVRDVCVQHISGSATVCKSWHEVRSMVGAGYALQTCGMEAFEMTRDQYGVAARDHRDSWSHAMAVIAVDDRPSIRSMYSSDGKSGLVLVQNSWGDVVTGPDVVFGTGKTIPAGSFWARWEDFRERYCVAFGPSKGWAAMKVPNWGTENIL